MQNRFEINNCLSREHKELAALLANFGNFLHGHGLKVKADWNSQESCKLFLDLHSALTFAVPRHFEVEEQDLFPLLSDNGLSQLVEILLEDHKLIRELIAELTPIIEKARNTATLTEPDWQKLHRQGLSLITELCAHAEKEEAALVPELEELLEDKKAEEIYKRYRSLCL